MPSQVLPISNHDLPKTSSDSKTSPTSYGGVENPSTRLLIPSTSEDDKLKKVKTLSRTLSHKEIGSPAKGGDHHRRTASENSLSLFVVRDGQKESQDPKLARPATESPSLGSKVLGFLGAVYRWVIGFVALIIYSLLLMPGFIQVGYYYFFSKRVRRGIVYGDQPRNRLDLYLPINCDGPKPVVAFLTGGAWIIGYKAWGSLLGQQLSERGIIVACIDYRNFPQGTISDMIKDSSQGISFVCKNIANYGGDPNRIYLMGQSAGAHIAACTLVEQAIREAGEGESASFSWSVTQLKAYFGLSGGYNLLNLTPHFHNRGLNRSTFLSIMEGENSMERFSPEVVVQDPKVRSAVARLPPIVLFHGTADLSIPPEASESFAKTLRGVGVTADAILYEGKSHTDLFLQDPMRGGKDKLFEDLIAKINGNDIEMQASVDVEAPVRRRLVPEFMLKLASIVSPF